MRDVAPREDQPCATLLQEDSEQGEGDRGAGAGADLAVTLEKREPLQRVAIALVEVALEEKAEMVGFGGEELVGDRLDRRLQHRVDGEGTGEVLLDDLDDDAVDDGAIAAQAPALAFVVADRRQATLDVFEDRGQPRHP
jgi:hypothetical protein